MEEAAAPEYVPPPVAPASRDLERADIERLMEELSNWGRWGPDDQLGAANLITPGKRLEALALATEGITVSLAHPVLKEAADDVLQPFGHSMLGVPDPSGAPQFFGGVGDNYNVSYHGSPSHLDSLCHILSDGKMYNGVSQDTTSAAAADRDARRRAPQLISDTGDDVGPDGAAGRLAPAAGRGAPRSGRGTLPRAWPGSTPRPCPG